MIFEKLGKQIKPVKILSWKTKLKQVYSAKRKMLSDKFRLSAHKELN